MNLIPRLSFIHIALLMLFSAPAVADEQAELMEAIDIDRATASPALAGTCTEVHFEITNRSDQSVHLLGLESAFASSVRLVARVDTDRTVTMESTTIPAEETLDLTTSHLSFELCGLKKPLRLGDVLEVTLDFVTWKQAVSIHVHD